MALSLVTSMCLLAPFKGRCDTLPSVPREFILNHCADCHDEETRKAGLNLVDLDYQPADSANLVIWVRVHDRVEAGEMPPIKKPRPEPAELGAFITKLAATLTASEEALLEGTGRAMQRRLNRFEYENALRDLLNVPWVQIRNQLPEDGEAHRYNKLGEALDVSHVQMARYLGAADDALRQAMSANWNRPPSTIKRHYARDEPSLTRNFRPRENSTLPDRHSFPVLDSRAQPEVRAGRAPISNPATREREAVGRVSSIFSDAGSYRWGEFHVPVAGKYRLRFSGYTIWVSGGGISRWFYEGQGDEKAPVYYLPLWHRPNADEIWPGRRDEPIGVYGQSSGQSRPLAAFDFEPEPSIREVEVVLTPDEVVQTDGLRLFRTRVNGTDEQYVNPLARPDGMPGYAVQWMEVEGPLPDASANAGYRLMFDDLPMKVVEPGQRGVAIEVAAPGDSTNDGGPRRIFAPRTEKITVEVETAIPRQDAERLIARFMRRAYRQPVKPAHVDRFVALFQQQYDTGAGFAKAMVSAYTGVLSSPGFLYTQEQPGALDDHALASRLSLFLWNSEPDQTLRLLADRGELQKPEVLRAETERMLNAPKSSRFIEAFTDYWLDLRKIDDTSPSTTLYNDYELDDPLKLSAVEETRLFVGELIDKDLPVRNLIDSDFTFLNERLADHYGVPGVRGAAMRNVKLPKGSVRGGLMTQASVLKVTANGTTTSPVLRGHWITERLLGVRIPPPPPVPAVEPDIRGAVTLRGQLEKHRNDPSCASCHSRMDPPGFALESFDVMGGWRDRYRAVKEGVEPERGVGMNGQAFAFHYALPVDSTGEMPDGRTFQDVRDFKELLLENDQVLAQNLARQLVVFATGAPVRFSDRKKIDAIVERARPSAFGVRTLIHEIVQSELFRMK